MRAAVPPLFAAALALAACAGCFGGESLGNHTGAGGSGGAGAGGSAGSSASGGAGGDLPGSLSTGTGGQFCGQVTTQIQPSLSDVLILMDRSGSMNDDSNGMTCTGGCGAASKWSLLAAAVVKLAAANPRVNWGLALYGSDNQCDVGVNPAVAFARSNDQAITAVLGGTTPGGEAPTSSAIASAVSILQEQYDGYPKYILLVTDGQSGCAGSADGGAADVTAETSISNARNQVGIPTFVLGLASSGDAAAIAALNQMAENGGEPSQGTANAFYAIGDFGPSFVPMYSAGSCVVPLPYPLQANLGVSVTLADGVTATIPQDPTSGWTFTDSTDSAIGLNGTYCTNLLDGTDTSITLYYSCAGLGL